MDKAKTSQRKRELNRKPDDPFPQHLAREQAHDPSVSRNSKRVEPWGDDRKGKFTGRRGRKRRKQDRKVNKQRRANKRERKEELDRRVLVAAGVAAWVTKLCGRSEVGIIVQCSIKGKFPREMQFTMYCPQGLVTASLIDIDKVHIREVKPWAEMTSNQILQLKRRHWKPFWPKNILQIIADELELG